MEGRQANLQVHVAGFEYGSQFCEENMNWHEYIHADPEILGGKPVVKGTRLAADFLLSLFAAGWTHEQVLQSYPGLTSESLRAVFAFAAEAMHEESFYALPLEQR